MKILLISPVLRSKVLGSDFAFKFPFLSLPVLASVTPEDVDVVIVDERVDKIDFEGKYDLVGITIMTPLAFRAYEIADRFRQRNVKVVLGGMHVSALPEEALEHADSLVIGEGEKVWPQLIEDFKAGKLNQIYKSDDFTDLNLLGAPRRNLLNEVKYAPVEFVETTRGCPFRCHFCSVTKFFGGKYRTRSVDSVIKELETFKTTTKRFSIKNVVFFVDDNIIGQRDHAKELFEKIKPFNLNWLGQASINIAKDEELLSLAKESGCMGILIGFESLSDAVLEDVAKKANRVTDYLWAIKKIHSYGIGIMGSFIFGFDGDDKTVFERYWDFIKQAKLEAVYAGILTPYPGTRFFEEFKQAGRILHHDWERYDTSNVVFRPSGMTEQELREGYLWAWKKSYSFYSIFKRLKNTTALKSFFWPMNIGFNLSVRKFQKSIN